MTKGDMRRLAKVGCSIIEGTMTMDFDDIINAKDRDHALDQEFNRRIRPYATEINKLKEQVSALMDEVAVIRERLPAEA